MFSAPLDPDENSGRRPKTVLCKCRRCGTFNPLTNLYEGGKMISRSSRDNHVRDDKLQNAMRASTFPDGHQNNGSASQQNTPPDHTQSDSARRETWINLIEREVQWYSELPVTSPTVPLVFLHDPALNGEYSWPSDEELFRANYGLHALKVKPRANAAFLETESRFCELITTLRAGPQTDLAVSALIDRLYDELGRLCYEKELQWAQQRSHLTPGPPLVNTGKLLPQCQHILGLTNHPEIHFYRRGPRDIMLRASSVVSLVMENIFFMPRRALRVQLAGIRDILRRSGAPLETIQQIPKYPSSCSTSFRLEPVTRQFLSCPACFCLYPYNPGDDPNSTEHPAIGCCSFKQTPTSSPCSEPLWSRRNIGGDRTRSVPRRKHLHQDLKSWLGRLLSRQGMEEILEKRPSSRSANPDIPIDDIWLSEVFLNLKDIFGQPFYPGPGQELRLVFGLSVDGFNPFHMKTAKQTASSTGVWLVLLNLPPHLRYLPENMFLVCVIPGPNKPSKSEINHALQLVVDDLLEFWKDGVIFSRTYRFRFGRLVRAMLVPLIADMMAVRQVIGLPGTSTAHYFCTFCDLDYDDIDVIDRTEWPPKNPVESREFATMWKAAQTEKHQEDIFNAFGVRWSALLDLPYWNPVLYSVIDSMHTLDLNLFQNHVRNVFKINLLKPGMQGDPQPNHTPHEKHVTTNKEKKIVARCVQLIYTNDDDLLYALLSYDRRILYTVCVDNGIIGEGHKLVVGTRWVLAKNITLWVSPKS